MVFYSWGDGPNKGVYYDAHPVEQMHYHLTMLAYDMNGEALSFGHGAPLRLRNEVQLGFKQVKWLAAIGSPGTASRSSARTAVLRLTLRPRCACGGIQGRQEHPPNPTRIFLSLVPPPTMP